MKFKIGDKIRLKKLTKKEFNNIYYSHKYLSSYTYKDYLNFFNDATSNGNAFTIENIDSDGDYDVKESEYFIIEEELLPAKLYKRIIKNILKGDKE